MLAATTSRCFELYCERFTDEDVGKLDSVAAFGIVLFSLIKKFHPLSILAFGFGSVTEPDGLNATKSNLGVRFAAFASFR